MRFRTTLIDPEGNEKILSEPEGLKGIVVSLNRHPELHSLIKEFKTSYMEKMMKRMEKIMMTNQHQHQLKKLHKVLIIKKIVMKKVKKKVQTNSLLCQETFSN